MEEAICITLSIDILHYIGEKGVCCFYAHNYITLIQLYKSELYMDKNVSLLIPLEVQEKSIIISNITIRHVFLKFKYTIKLYYILYNVTKILIYQNKISIL